MSKSQEILAALQTIRPRSADPHRRGGWWPRMVAMPGLDEAQLKRAVQALLKHVAKQHEGAKELFDDDELLYLVRAGRQAPAVSCAGSLLKRRRLRSVREGCAQVVALKKTPQQQRKDKPQRM